MARPPAAAAQHRERQRRGEDQAQDEPHDGRRPSVWLISGRNACRATASRPKPVTARNPSARSASRADVPQARSPTNPSIHAPPRPDRQERTEDEEPPPRAVRRGDGLRDRAREGRGHPGLPREIGGIVPRELGRQARALTRNSASGICHRKIRYASPPARRPPARLRSLSKAWTASRTVGCCSFAWSNSRRARRSSSAAERRARAIRPASLEPRRPYPRGRSMTRAARPARSGQAGGGLGSGGGRLRLQDVLHASTRDRPGRSGTAIVAQRRGLLAPRRPG